jgi:AbrB family looped-hinge helix DNA binding protein
MKLVKVATGGRVTIPASLRKKYGLQPGRKVIYEADDEGMKIIPLVTTEEVKNNIGFLGATSQRSGKKGKLLKGLMGEKKLEKEF